MRTVIPSRTTERALQYCTTGTGTLMAAAKLYRTPPRLAVIDKQKVDGRGKPGRDFTWHQNRQATDWHLPSLWHDPNHPTSRLVSSPPRTRSVNTAPTSTQPRRASLRHPKCTQLHPVLHSSPHRIHRCRLSHRSQSPAQTAEDESERDRTPSNLPGPNNTPRITDRPAVLVPLLSTGLSISYHCTSIYPAPCQPTHREASLCLHRHPRTVRNHGGRILHRSSDAGDDA